MDNHSKINESLSTEPEGTDLGSKGKGALLPENNSKLIYHKDHCQILPLPFGMSRGQTQLCLVIVRINETD